MVKNKVSNVYTAWPTKYALYVKDTISLLHVNDILAYVRVHVCWIRITLPEWIEFIQ